MKTISAGTATHVAQETTTLSTCWKLTRRDAQVFGFTEADTSLVVAGVTYTPTSGYTRSAISTNSTLSVDNLDLEALLDDTAITEADLLAGLWDHAEIRIFSVNRADTTQIVKQRRGWLGEVTIKDGTFTCELRGLAQVLQSSVGELFSPACRADFCDTRCGLTLATYTDSGTVTSVTSYRVFADTSLVAADGFYDGGLVTFTSGLNTGLEMEVKAYTVGNVALQQPMPYEVAVGDTFSITEGCDKSLAACIARGNVINFRGEPHLPGNDKILRGPN
jgi:uncharacterized phage protein (TIGR02218 family)